MAKVDTIKLAVEVRINRFVQHHHNRLNLSLQNSEKNIDVTENPQNQHLHQTTSQDLRRLEQPN